MSSHPQLEAFLRKVKGDSSLLQRFWTHGSAVSSRCAPSALCYGAIGVSGMTPDLDAEVARAGLAAFELRVLDCSS